MIRIDTVGDAIRQFAKFLCIEALPSLFIREEENHLSAPSLKVALHGCNIAHRMVCRLLTGTEDSYDIIPTAGCSKQAGFFSAFGQGELVFGVEVADDLDFILAFAHLQLDVRCLVGLNREETDFREDAAVGHSSAGNQHIVAFVQRERFLQEGTPGVARTHVCSVRAFEVERLQGTIFQHFGNREVAIILRVLQRLDGGVGSDYFPLLGIALYGSFEIYVHPTILIILYLLGHRFDACRHTHAACCCHEEDIAGMLISHACLPNAFRHDGDTLRIQVAFYRNILFYPIHQFGRVLLNGIARSFIYLCSRKALIRSQELVADTRVHDILYIQITFYSRRIVQMIGKDRSRRVAQVFRRDYAQEIHRHLPFLGRRLAQELLNLGIVASAGYQILDGLCLVCP